MVHKRYTTVGRNKYAYMWETVHTDSGGSKNVYVDYFGKVDEIDIDDYDEYRKKRLEAIAKKNEKKKTV